MRRAARRDENERGLVHLALRLGAVIYRYGPLDFWVLHRGRFIPTEVKNRNGRNRYTEGQLAFLRACEQEKATVWTWRDEADVLSALGHDGPAEVVRMLA